jgi:hypothetical protein
MAKLCTASFWAVVSGLPAAQSQQQGKAIIDEESQEATYPGWYVGGVSIQNDAAIV